MEERIKGMYNDCWFIYKQYLESHDMAAYNDNAGGLVKKYDCQDDIKELLSWFAPRINGIHEKYMRQERRRHGAG